MCLRVGMAYRGSSVDTIFLKPLFSTTLYGRRSLHMKTATDSVISCARAEFGGSLQRKDLSSCICLESTGLAVGCCRASAWCRLKWLHKIVLLQYFSTAWHSLHTTLLLSISCVPGLHWNPKWLQTSAFKVEGAAFTLLLPASVAMLLLLCGRVRPPSVQRKSHKGVAHSAPHWPEAWIDSEV